MPRTTRMVVCIGGTRRTRHTSKDIMARKIRDARLESRSARLRLPVRKKPYTGPALARGIHLLYRRNKGNGTWVVKAASGHGGYGRKALPPPTTSKTATPRMC